MNIDPTPYLYNNKIMRLVTYCCLQVLKLFGDLIHCSEEAMHRVLNMGLLATVQPRWKELKLSGGWSLCFRECRKVAVALKHQPNRRCQEVAMSAIRSKAQEGQVDQPWLELLTLGS